MLGGPSTAEAAPAEIADSEPAGAASRPALSGADAAVALRTAVAGALERVEVRSARDGSVVSADAFAMPTSWRPADMPKARAAVPTGPVMPKAPQPTSQLTGQCVVVDNNVVKIGERTGEWQLLSVDAGGAMFLHVPSGGRELVPVASQPR